MSESQQLHAIIIGAGVIGACTTYFLSKNPSCKVTVIEKTDIACGASGKSGGFLALDWNDHSEYLKPFSQASFQLHQELAKELDGASQYGYRALDTYSIVFDRKSDTYSKKKDPLEWVNKDAVRSIEQIGTLETTAQLHPEFFTRKLIEEAKRTERVDVRIGQGVARLIYENGKDVRGVVLDDGTEIHGDRVVVCMGPWSKNLPLPYDTIRIKGSHVHSIVLQPQDRIPGHALFTTIMHESKRFEPEVYPRSDGTVYICGASDEEPLPKSADQVIVNPKSIEDLTNQAELISAKLSRENSKVIRRQACYLPISEETNAPLIGPHPRYENLYLATGHSFWGILNSPITGKMMSEWLLDGKVSCVSEAVAEYFMPS
ncbi:hypothetical protein RMATCC62417_12398 [Rhizopus microsporus]|nr:hypothetical protein RMATCC62417_12398 [Rhizopus microsporus]